MHDKKGKKCWMILEVGGENQMELGTTYVTHDLYKMTI